MNQKAISLEVLNAFCLDADPASVRSYGDGHINDTFLVEVSGTDKFILQRINTEIFHHPEELMENISGVTGWLQKKIIEEGGDPARETLNVKVV